MDPKAEIDKVSKMLKDSGFKLVDVQFEGVVEAMDARVTAVINKMAETQQAFGVFRIYYECEGDTRMIEIPVGAMPGGEAPPEAPPAKGR
jgi:uncharacterized protein YqgV (UPF0045/DUF77 family)